VPHNISVDNVNVANNFMSKMYVTSAHDVTVKNANFGPSYDFHGIVHCATICPPTARPYNITLQHVFVHDHTNSVGCLANSICLSAHHMGCGPTFNDAYNIMLDGYQADNCQTSTGMLFKSNQYGLHDVTMQNSWFGTCGTGVQLDDTNSSTKRFSNFHFYNNTFKSCRVTLLSGTAASATGMEYKGNIGWINGTPSTGWSATYNWSSGAYATCTGSAICSNDATGASYGLDMDGVHLLSGSSLIGALGTGPSPTWLPPTDIDGQARPQNTAFEPGADER
jgi:hypothetical protein